MKYVMFILSFGFFVANTVRAEDVNTGADEGTVEQSDGNHDSATLNLEDGKSSNLGWWNLGYGHYIFPRHYGYGYGYSNCCGSSYYNYDYGCGRYPSYSWGYYNQNYLYRVPPMVR